MNRILGIVLTNAVRLLVIMAVVMVIAYWIGRI